MTLRETKNAGRKERLYLRFRHDAVETGTPAKPSEILSRTDQL